MGNTCDQVLSELETADLVKSDQFDLGEVYQRYYQIVFRTCLKLLKNQTEAEDITQDVFVQVQRNWQSFRGEATLSSWLYRIAVNQVYMHWRKKSVRVEITTSDDEMPELANGVRLEQNSQTQIDSIALLEAIGTLPNGMRTVLTLHDLFGFNHDEIGIKLGIDSGTSKSQLHKARLKLRELLRSRN